MNPSEIAEYCNANLFIYVKPLYSFTIDLSTFTNIVFITCIDNVEFFSLVSIIITILAELSNNISPILLYYLGLIAVKKINTNFKEFSNFLNSKNF